MSKARRDVNCDLLDLCHKFNNFHHRRPQVPGPVKPFFCDENQVRCFHVHINGSLYSVSLNKLFKPSFHPPQVGLVRSEFEPALADHPDLFLISADKIELNPKLKSFEERSAALDVAVRKMRAEANLESLREEDYHLFFLISDW